MIKFFRQIRQNMIRENRASKYLLYAIGEIILVVIGILIAENLTSTQKGGFSTFLKKMSDGSPIGAGGQRNGNHRLI